MERRSVCLARSRGRGAVAMVTAGLVAALAGCGGGAATTPTEVGTGATTPRTSHSVLTRTSERAHDPEALKDTDIAGAVQARIARDESIPPSSVLVAVQGGVATLSGTLPSLVAVERAREIAARTRGVTGIENRLQVRVAGRDDQAIRDDVQRALEWDAELGERDVDVTVDGSHVTLEGRVGSLSERRLANALARRVRGVTSIADDLEVVPATPRSDQELAGLVRVALARDARLDPGAIEVAVDEGTVTLRGAVASAVERELARELAERAGATRVETGELEVRWWARDQMRREDAASPPDDAETAAHAREAILRDPRVGATDVAVTVSDGVATVRGDLASAAARDAALADVLATPGISRVIDQLEVRRASAIDDEALAARASARLAASSATAGVPIEVSVRNGVVTLRGEVPSRDRVREAVFAVTRLAGVRRVEPRLSLDAMWEPLDDWELATAIREGIAWSPFLDRVAVRVDVADGVATLRGDVDDERARREAEREAYEAGAVEVHDEITVRGRAVGAPRVRSSAPSP